MNLLALIFVQVTAFQAPAFDSELEVALGTASLTSRTARFDPNILRMFRQGEFTTPLYDACHENPWRIPLFAQTIRQEVASSASKPQDTLTTCLRQLGWQVRRSLVGDPIQSHIDTSKKANDLDVVMADWKQKGWVTGTIPPTASVPKEVQAAAALILRVLPFSMEMRKLAFQSVSELDSAFQRLTSKPSDDDISQSAWFRALGSKADLGYLGAGGVDLLAACQEAMVRIAVVDEDMAFSFRVATKFGTIVLSGGKSSTYDETCLLVIDTGKSDTYMNMPCNRSATNPISIVLDSNGDDRYLSEIALRDTELEKWPQRGGAASKPGPSAAVLGYSILMDHAGNDLYRTHRNGIGSGRFGIAFCIDQAGDDIYDSYQDSQGFGTFGIGVLEDHAGNDKYFGFSQVQACGQTGGVGMLLDRAGDDQYVANDSVIDLPSAQSAQHNISMSQGAGNGRRGDYLDGHSLAGGVGILADLSGKDTYTCGIFGQGVGYWEGVGMLLDDNGNDSYLGQWYVQGASAHFAIGYLDDGDGNDTYSAPMNMAQGAGHDFGIGVLIDRMGDDTHKAPNLSLGAGNANGFGWFVDAAGTDTYEANGVILGTVTEAPKTSLRIRALCLGVFMDLAGDDVYPSGAPWAKNAVRTSQVKDRGPTPGESQLGVFWDR